MIVSGGALFALCLLVMFFLLGAACFALGFVLVIQMAWQHFRQKRDEDLELKQEQAQAVAVAEAHVRQHFYDNGSGQGASV